MAFPEKLLGKPNLQLKIWIFCLIYSSFMKHGSCKCDLSFNLACGMFFFLQMPKQYPFNNLYLEKGGDPDKMPTVKHYTFEPAD